jgi:hypothetical protein
VKLPRYRHAFAAGVAASFIGPAYVFVRAAFATFYVPDRLVTVLWPCYRYFLGPDNGYDDPQLANRFLALSLGTNLFFYILLFSALWGVAWLARASIRPAAREKTI